MSSSKALQLTGGPFDGSPASEYMSQQARSHGWTPIRLSRDPEDLWYGYVYFPDDDERAYFGGRFKAQLVPSAKPVLPPDCVVGQAADLFASILSNRSA